MSHGAGFVGKRQARELGERLSPPSSYGWAACATKSAYPSPIEGKGLGFHPHPTASNHPIMTSPTHLKIKVQLFCGDEIAMGPGKADLLEAIAREGSISAAGRALGMSYRRTWLLVDAMNRCWERPLVETAVGGGAGGGARVSELGHEVLGHYRALQQGLAKASEGGALAIMLGSLREAPRASQQGE